MVIDLETDENKFNFRWVNIEGSEDYKILEMRGFNKEEDHYETGEYAKIIRYLQLIAPHIQWRYTFDGTDSYGAWPSQWRVICVPVDHFTEAQFVFDRFLNNDNLENYSYTDRYPEIYDRLPNEQPKLNDDIVVLYELLQQYEETLFSKELSLFEFFDKLSKILPQIYYYTNLLPFVSEAPDLQHQGTMFLKRNLDLSPYDEFSNIPDPFQMEVETFLLSDLLLSIYEDIKQGLIAFSTNQPDLIGSAVNDWAIGFSIEHGWGRDILIALFAIHQAKYRIENKSTDL